MFDNINLYVVLIFIAIILFVCYIMFYRDMNTSGGFCPCIGGDDEDNYVDGGYSGGDINNYVNYGDADADYASGGFISGGKLSLPYSVSSYKDLPPNVILRPVSDKSLSKMKVGNSISMIACMPNMQGQTSDKSQREKKYKIKKVTVSNASGEKGILELVEGDKKNFKDPKKDITSFMKYYKPEFHVGLKHVLLEIEPEN